MHHPIPRFEKFPIAPPPVHPPRFIEADNAIHAKRLADRPEALDEQIGWFPGAAKKKYQK